MTRQDYSISPPLPVHLHRHPSLTRTGFTKSCILSWDTSSAKLTSVENSHFFCHNKYFVLKISAPGSLCRQDVLLFLTYDSGRPYSERRAYLSVCQLESSRPGASASNRDRHDHTLPQSLTHLPCRGILLIFITFGARGRENKWRRNRLSSCRCSLLRSTHV